MAHFNWFITFFKFIKFTFLFFFFLHFVSFFFFYYVIPIQNDIFGTTVATYKESMETIFKPGKASAQSELFWRGVVHSFYVHNNQLSEMGQVMTSVGPIVDRPIEIFLLANHQRVFSYDRQNPLF